MSVREEAERLAGPHYHGRDVTPENPCWLPADECVWLGRATAIESALLAAEERGRREGIEAAAKVADDPTVLAFGPGGSEGTRAALAKLGGDEFAGLIDDACEFIAAEIRGLLPRPEPQETK